MSGGQFAGISTISAANISSLPTGRTNALIPLPPYFELYERLAPVINQRNIPASAAFSAAFAVRSYNNLMAKSIFSFSHYPSNSETSVTSVTCKGKTPRAEPDNK